MIRVIASASYSYGPHQHFSKEFTTLTPEEEELCRQVAAENNGSLSSLRENNRNLYYTLRREFLRRAERHAYSSASCLHRRYGRVDDSVYGGIMPRHMCELESITLKLDMNV